MSLSTPTAGADTAIRDLSAVNREIERLLLRRRELETSLGLAEDAGLRMRALVTALVADVWGLPERALFDRTQAHHVTEPRMVCWLLLTEEFALSSAHIGRLWKKDHATVLHGLRTIRALGETRPAVRSRITTVRERLARSLEFPKPASA
jgi:chromosomal replication initiation ATPase DnaA